MHRFKIPFFIFSILIMTFQVEAVDRRGRLGIGLSNELQVDVPAISFKLQKSKSFAIGGILGFNNDDSDGGFGAGLKLYRNIFDEPQLTFYSSLLGAMIKEKRNNGATEESGFQVDLTLGSEFNFVGLQSLGFTLEAGFSFNKLDDFVIETVGNSAFFVGAMHFYL